MKFVFCNIFAAVYLIKSIIFYLLALDQLPPSPPLKKSLGFGLSSERYAPKDGSPYYFKGYSKRKSNKMSCKKSFGFGL